MRIETLLYVYLFICSGMIVFNIITAIVLKRRDRRTVRASARFRQHILQQIERINTGQQVERRHKKYLSRQLTRTGNMIAFDKMLEDLYREEPRQATEYLSQLGGVIVYTTTSCCYNYIIGKGIEVVYDCRSPPLNEQINRVTTAFFISRNFARFFLPLAERAFSLAKQRKSC